MSTGAAASDSPGESTAGRSYRRHPLAPAIPAALSLCAALLGCLRIGRLPVALAAAALIAAALAAATALPPIRRPGEGGLRCSFSVVLLCVALGTGVGMARLWPLLPLCGTVRRAPARDAGPRAGAGAIRSGIPLSGVRRFEAVLARDGGAAPGQPARYELRLLRVMTGQGERSARAAGPVVLHVEGGPRLSAGRTVVVQGKLEPAPLGEWPALHSRVPSGALSVGGYHTAGAASRARLVEALRARIASLEAGPAGTLEALLLGSREEVDPGLYDGFRASGSLHLLALSGLHAGVLYLLGSLILWFVPRPRVRRLGACAFVVAYLILAGFRPSLFRAVVMIVTAAAAALLDRDSRPLNLLALAAVILLLVDPGSVLSLSFQLSFLALAGILVLGPGLERALERALPRMAAAPLAYSMAAQAATAPLLLHHFGSLRPVGILAALPLIPLVTLFIWSGVAYLALAATAAGGALAGFLASVHRVLEASVGLFARVPPVYGAAGVAVAAVLLAAGLLVCGLPVRGRRVPGLPAP